MAELNKNLITKIMLYVSHPCADMIRNCLCDNFDNDNDLVLHTQSKFIPKLDCYTHSIFKVRDDTSSDDEFSYEYIVVQKIIYNKLNVWAVNEDTILRLCPEYVHFNNSIIKGILIEDEERLEDFRRENDPYYARPDSTDEESDSTD